MALISLIVYLFDSTSPSFAAACHELSCGHSKPIDSIKLDASAHLCAQLPRVIDARSKVYKSVSVLSMVATAETI